MLALLRHAASKAILPFTVVVLVPCWIAWRYNVALALGRLPVTVLLQVVGILLLAFGFALFVASLRRFATEGKGTLAPWDPPRVFVASGPYRLVRNPMISGVIFMLCGEALVLLSRLHVVRAAFCVGLNLIYIPIVEEPQLRRRFGVSYEEYCGNVPRFIPLSRRGAAPHSFARSESAERDNCVQSAESEGIRERCAHLLFARFVWNVIEVAFGVRDGEIRGRRQDAAVHGEGGCDGFDCPGGAERVAMHGFR